MKTVWISGLCGALYLFAAAGYAQMSILPAPCIGKTGEELDKCVRDLVPPLSTRFEPAETVPNPAQMVNCLKVDPADRGFCIARNEVIIECRNALKHPDSDRCFATYVPNIMRASTPAAVKCEREKPEQRAKCASRNAVLTKCVADPLRYFLCIGQK
jgi:hypothetical protein